MIQSKKYLKASVLVDLLASLPIMAGAATEDPILTASSLNFFTQYFDGKITSASITVYNKKKETLHDIDIKLDIPLPANIKQAIFSPNTQNPFKKAYATFYTPANFKQLKTCPFTGIDFNIDNNLKTEEWYITTPAAGCIKGQRDIDGVTSHNWIIQRDEVGKFRVLMESDKSLTIDPVTSQSPYKPLSTYHSIQRFMPKSTLECGDAYIKWRYNNTKKQYQYFFKKISIGNPCNGDLAFESTDDLGLKKAVAAIEKIVNPWIKNNLPAFR
ncbi:hypothetical protein [Thiofilum flexile]|uniref:hypothetical protein n=1 Tax=Thiofilum flexile TaxID=125627 RepID=UPI000374EB84|nr:hypothetical protein [Thiofilum flexile]